MHTGGATSTGPGSCHHRGVPQPHSADGGGRRFRAAPSRPRPPSGATSRDVWGRMPRAAGTRGPHRCDGGTGPTQEGAPTAPRDNATQLAANKTEFTKRKTHNACFACLNAKVQYNQSHLACVQHGPTASMAKRTDPKLRVTGAALPGKAF